MNRLLICALAALIAFAGVPSLPSAAPLQLRGSFIVIDPGEEFVEADLFAGLVWADARGSILIGELPADAYASMARSLLEDGGALFGEGIELDRRGKTRVDGHPAVLSRGRQQVGVHAFEKWFLMVNTPQATLMITGQMPTVFATPKRMRRMDEAFASIAIAAERDDPRAALSFTFRETDRFRHLRTMSGSAVLLSDVEYSGNKPSQPLFVIATSQGQSCAALETGVRAIAEDRLRSLRRVSNLRRMISTDAVLGTDRGVVTEARGESEGASVLVVQTFRVNGCRYARTVGIAPLSAAELYRAEFTELANGFAWREQIPPPLPDANPNTAKPITDN